MAGDNADALAFLDAVFQFTPARGGRRPRTEDGGVFRRFNSRPRVAGDPAGDEGGVSDRVSIHARAWRATVGLPQEIAFNYVSIHARAWRATLRDREL